MQLIGITSLMIACKTEEILCPEVDDYVYICDNAYNSGKFKWGHIRNMTHFYDLVEVITLHF